jgi:hypothetical protein
MFGANERLQVAIFLAAVIIICAALVVSEFVRRGRK